MTLDQADTIDRNAPPDTPTDQQSSESANENTSKHTETFGSFFLDKSEFALPVSAVQEVVNEPVKISPVPMCHSYVVGLFNLRGLVIPIVDLRVLLEFPARETTGSRKIAIVEYGDECIGLLFDRTGEVLSDRGAARIAIKANTTKGKTKVIGGALKLENGERLVQILDPTALLKLESLPLTSGETNKHSTRSKLGKRMNCISFQTGHTSCAIDLRYVKEVKVMPEVDQTLFSGGHVLGTTNLRGEILPVIDFRAFMGDDAVFHLGKTTPVERKLLILETPEGPVALMVFSVDSIMQYYKGDILPFARIALKRREFVSGCLIDGSDKITMLLNHEKLMNEASLVEAARSCREVHHPKGVNEVAENSLSSHKRRTFIKFTFERSFALDTSYVSEVINRPKEVLSPPYALSFVEGIFNLRGEMITLFNPRLLYGLSGTTSDNQKVLIFKHEEAKYGILVDSVDEIIATTDESILDLSSLKGQGAHGNLAEDTAGCLQQTLPDGRKSSVLILDVNAFVERCVQAETGVL